MIRLFSLGSLARSPFIDKEPGESPEGHGEQNIDSMEYIHAVRGGSLAKTHQRRNPEHEPTNDHAGNPQGLFHGVDRTTSERDAAQDAEGDPAAEPHIATVLSGFLRLRTGAHDLVEK